MIHVGTKELILYGWNRFIKESIIRLGESIIEYFSSKVVKLSDILRWVNIQGQTTYRSLIRVNTCQQWRIDSSQFGSIHQGIDY